MVHNFTMTGILVLSLYLGWRHCNEPFYDDRRAKMPSRAKWRAIVLSLAGAGFMLLVLLDPNGSTARATYQSMSTTGFKVFWLFLMGGLVLTYGTAQLAFHDMAARFHRFIKNCKCGHSV